MVDDVKRSISKRSWSTPDATCSVDTKIDMNLPQINSGQIDLHGPKEEGPSSKRSVIIKAQEYKLLLSRTPNGSQQKHLENMMVSLALYPARKTKPWPLKSSTIIRDLTVCLTGLWLLLQRKLMNGYKSRIRNDIMLLEKSQSPKGSWEIEDYL